MYVVPPHQGPDHPGEEEELPPQPRVYEAWKGSNKASQLIVRAARLNEAFSEVRRVPVIRLLPPAGGLNLWPAAGSIRALDW